MTLTAAFIIIAAMTIFGIWTIQTINDTRARMRRHARKERAKRARWEAVFETTDLRGTTAATETDPQ